MISVRGLRLAYGSHEVLKGIDLQVGKGEIVCVMGSSGGGKTTLLRCLAGLAQPDEGEIEVDGVDVRLHPEVARQRMGMVFQAAALFDFMDVRDNVLFGVRRHLHVGRARQQEIVSEALRRVGLEEASHKMPSELSGGMKKRVGLARALALSPKVLLYDEPTTGLDPITTYAIDQLIGQTRGDREVTSVVVSHDVASVFRLADRILFLHEGEIGFLGDPSEFRRSRHPAVMELLAKAEAVSL